MYLTTLIDCYPRRLVGFEMMCYLPWTMQRVANIHQVEKSVSAERVKLFVCGA